MESKVIGVGSIVFKDETDQEKFLKSLEEKNIKNLFIRGGCLYFKKLEVTSFFKINKLIQDYKAEYIDYFNLADFNAIPVYKVG